MRVPILFNAIDPAVVGYAGDVAASGGNVDVSTLKILDAFVKGCKVDGIWDLLDWIWPCAGIDLAAGLSLLKRPPGVAKVTNVSFVSGDYSPAGLTGNGSSKRLDTSYAVSTQGSANASSCHLACYLSRYAASPGGVDVQCGNNTHQIFTQNYTSLFTNNANRTLNPSMGGGPPGGLLILTGLATNAAAYRRGASVATASGTAALPAGNATLFAVAGGGSYSNKTLGYASFGQGFTAAQAFAYDARVEKLMADLGRSALALVLPTTSVGGILCVGQSNMNGQQATTALTPFQNYASLMFVGGVRPGNTAPAALLAGLVPLADWGNVGADGGVVNQTIASAFTQSLGSSGSTSALLLHCAALGSTAVSGLDQGTTPYTGSMTQATAAVSAVAYSGQSLDYRAVFCIQGEQDDQNNSTTYATDLATWAGHYNTDLKAKTGQGASVPFFFSQVSQYPINFGGNRTTALVSVQQLAAHVANPSALIMVAPTYIWPDGLHFTSASIRHLSEYFAKAYKAVVVNGGSFSPLRPLSVTRSGADITVVFNKGGLVFDATLVADASGSYASRKFGTAASAATDTTTTNKLGFEFCDDATTNPSVSISGFNGQGLVVASINANFGTTNITGDTLTVNLSGAPTSTNKRLRYAYSATLAAAANKGNLRDADTGYPSAFGNALYNWCAICDSDAS